MPLLLMVSDLHLGRGSSDEDRAAERDFIQMVSHFRPKLSALYLLGDVFEQYIEYRHMVPKGASRLLGFLARLTDEGLPVWYIVGNRDPWHLNYFEKELGVRVVFDYLNASSGDRNILMAHGDGRAKNDGFYRFLKPILRHPWPVALYKHLFPADVGFRIARQFSRIKRDDGVNQDVVRGLQDEAHNLLAESAPNVVVFGHSHEAELTETPDGFYLNTGFWYLNKTFGWIENGTIHLGKWENQRVITLKTCHQPNQTNI